MFLEHQKYLIVCASPSNTELAHCQSLYTSVDGVSEHCGQPPSSSPRSVLQGVSSVREHELPRMRSPSLSRLHGPLVFSRDTSYDLENPQIPE